MAYDEFGQYVEDDLESQPPPIVGSGGYDYRLLNEEYKQKTNQIDVNIARALRRRAGVVDQEPQLDEGEPFNYQKLRRIVDGPPAPITFEEPGNFVGSGLWGATKGVFNAIPFVGSHVTSPLELSEAPTTYDNIVTGGSDLIAGFGEGIIGAIAGGAATANPLGAIAGAGTAAAAGDLARSAEQKRIEQEKLQARGIEPQEGYFSNLAGGYSELDKGDLGQAALAGVIGAGGAGLGAAANRTAIKEIGESALLGDDVLKKALGTSIAKQGAYDVATGGVQGVATDINQQNMNPFEADTWRNLDPMNALKAAALSGATSVGAQGVMLGGVSGMRGRTAAPDSDLGRMRDARERGTNLGESFRNSGAVESEDIQKFRSEIGSDATEMPRLKPDESLEDFIKVSVDPDALRQPTDIDDLPTPAGDDFGDGVPDFLRNRELIDSLTIDDIREAGTAEQRMMAKTAKKILDRLKTVKSAEEFKALTDSYKKVDFTKLLPAPKVENGDPNPNADSASDPRGGGVGSDREYVFEALKSNPVVEVRLEDIKLSKDVPNFKEGSDPLTGEVMGEELEGSYERLGTPPIIVWRRNNGDLEVITGRHRLGLARRSGEQTIPAQIVNEADGFDSKRARILDAEMNIRDEKGSDRDFATYFRESGIGEEEAKSAGLISRKSQQAGFNIGNKAVDSLYTAFMDNRIDSKRASAIAEGAPRDERIQTAVFDNYIMSDSKPSAEELRDQARYMKWIAETGGDRTQDDMFGGFNDELSSVLAKISKIVNEERKSLNDELAFISKPSRSPEEAKKYGISVTDPAALSLRAKEIRKRLGMLDNWMYHDDIRNDLMERAGIQRVDPNALVDEPTPVEEPEFDDPDQGKFFSAQPGADTGKGEKKPRTPKPRVDPRTPRQAIIDDTYTFSGVKEARDPQTGFTARGLDGEAMLNLVQGMKARMELIKSGRARESAADKATLGFMQITSKGVDIGLKPNLKVILGNDGALRVQGHEIGHLFDMLPKDGIKEYDPAIQSLKDFFDEFKVKMTPLLKGNVKNKKSLRRKGYEFSKDWRPFDENKVDTKFLKYRQSGKEIVADMFSALLVDPGYLQQKFPEGFNLIAKYLKSHPEAMSHWDKIQDLVSLSSDERHSLTQSRIHKGFEAGLRKQKEIQKSKDSEKSVPTFTENYIEKHQKVYKSERELIKAGRRDVATLENTIQKMEFDSEAIGYQTEFESGAMKSLEKSFGKMGTEQWNKAMQYAGELIQYRRIALGDRDSYFNPQNLDKDTAMKRLESLESKLRTDGKLKAINDWLDFQRKWNQEILDRQLDYGRIDQERYDTLTKDNKHHHYAPFIPVDYADVDIALFKDQKGTLRDVMNPAVANQLKQMGMIRYLQGVDVRNKAIDTLLESGSSYIRKPKLDADGKPINNELGKMDLMSKWVGGKEQQYLVDKTIARAINEIMGGGELGTLSRFMAEVANPATRMLYLTYNTQFGLRQVVRDIAYSYLTLPKFANENWIKEAWNVGANYFRTAKEAYRGIKHGEFSEDYKQLLKEGILADPGGGMTSTRKHRRAKDRLLMQMGIRDPEFDPLKKVPAWLKFHDALSAFVETTEVIPKLSQHKMAKSRGNMHDTQRQLYLRNSVGTPNINRGGLHKKQMNAWFQFSNVYIQGLKNYAELWTKQGQKVYGGNRGRLLVGSLAVVASTSALEWLAEAGLFGDNLREAMEKTSKTDRANFFNIPTGMWRSTKDGGREPVNIRIPLPENLRWLKMSTYLTQQAMMNEHEDGLMRWGRVLTAPILSMVEQMPGFTSSVKSLGEAAINYDTFRERPIYDSYDSPLDKAKAIGGHLFGSLGINKKLLPWQAPGAFVSTVPASPKAIYDDRRKSEPIPRSVLNVHEAEKKKQRDARKRNDKIKREVMSSKDINKANAILSQYPEITPAQRRRLLIDMKKGLTSTEKMIENLPKEARAKIREEFKSRNDS